MKKYIPLTILLLCFIAPVGAQGLLKATDKKIVNEKGENVLLRGIGLGGWMLQEGYMLGVNQEAQQHRIRERMVELIGEKETAQFYESWLKNFVTKADIDSLHAWGFNSVRLPMHYALYTLPVDKEPVKGQNTWLDKGFRMTDSLLAWCKANKIYLILDLHAAPGGQGNDLNIADRDPSKPSLWESEADQQKMIALWKKLAQRYVNEPWIGAYDIINEPNWGFSDLANDKNGTKEPNNAPLRKLMMEITAAIREVDKKHIIIIEGNGWGNNYNGVFPLWDNNMVISFHKYWNRNDDASIRHIIEAREKNNAPVWLGETGENSNTWFTEAIALFERNNIGWSWWPLKKLGFNNPLQVRSNPAYEKVTAYWNKRGDKPAEQEAKKGLMELVNSVRIQNNIFHKDVVDAMFRQPFNRTAVPYTPQSFKGSIILPAVNFDLGRNGVAYYDMDTADYRQGNKRGVGNRGRVYRNDGVDIRSDSATKDGFYVSDIEDGEWLQYTVMPRQKGKYKLVLTVATDKTPGKISVMNDGKMISQNISLPNTGNNQHWETVEINDVALDNKWQSLRIIAEQGGFNLKSIELRQYK